MDYLHLASKKHIDSILTHGLIPAHIQIDSHWETFNEHGLKERKCVYSWMGETYNNSKLIRDMIYTKFFIHPRNELYDIHDHEIDFRKLGNKLRVDSHTFFLLKISDMDMKFGTWEHLQEPSDDPYCTTTIMDDKYAHDNKIITISESTIKPQKLEVIEEVKVRIYNDNSIGFSHSKPPSFRPARVG